MKCRQQQPLRLNTSIGEVDAVVADQSGLRTGPGPIKGIYDKRPGARFENLVATHLLKRLQFLEDKTGDRLALNYLRDRDQREVDFVITKKKEVVELIEVKYSDEAPSASLRHYAKVLKPKRAVQIVYTLERGFTKDGVEVLSPIDYFASPPWAT